MYIKCEKGDIVVEVQIANAIPPNTQDYTYSEIAQEEYESILADFAANVPSPEPDLQADMAELLIDLAYRTTLLELGVSI